MHPFEEYLQQRNINPLNLSLKAQVRYLIVWNAMKEHPITPAHAQQIREAVFTMCGVPFSGSFVLMLPEPVDDQQTLPMKAVLKHNLI